MRGQTFERATEEAERPEGDRRGAVQRAAHTPALEERRGLSKHCGQDHQEVGDEGHAPRYRAGSPNTRPSAPVAGFGERGGLTCQVTQQPPDPALEKQVVEVDHVRGDFDYHPARGVAAVPSPWSPRAACNDRANPDMC